LLEKWMVLHEKGGSIRQYFEVRNVQKVIIYGLGKMANHLIEDIKNSGINIVCAIDIKAADKCEDFPTITLEETIPDADCIIITPVHEFISIKQKLAGKTSIPIISLSDVIDECIQ